MIVGNHPPRRYFEGKPGSPITKYFIQNLGDGPRVYRSDAVKVGDDSRESLREVYLRPDGGTFEPIINDGDNGASMLNRIEHVPGAMDRNLYLAKGLRFARTEAEIRAVIEKGAANKALNAENRRLRNPAENVKDTVKGIVKEIAAVMQAPRQKGGA